jgi:hypothetical protein
MTDVEEVIAAARARADALAHHDGAALSALLHPAFVWTSHRGQAFDRDAYVAANSGPASRWVGQTLDDVRVSVVGSTAVVVAVVVDVVVDGVLDGGGDQEVFRMPVTQTWVREDGTWLCLAGHAGPRL